MKAVIFIHVLYLILIKTFMVKGVSKCESKVELRAVLLSCPTKDNGCDDDDPLSQVMKSEESQILQADPKNFEFLREEKERGFPNMVRDCKRKLAITLKFKNFGKMPCDDEYIVVDHVFDPVTGGRGRLLSPVVLKLRQEQMIQLYGLQFQRVVNSDPFEEQKVGGQTCSVSSENPTCGIATYDGKPIPFSEGFCCSCDPRENAKRQMSPTPREGSLLYRDYKLISQGTTRFVREEKTPIVNPSLLKLRSESSDEITEEKKGLDCGGFTDPLSWDKIPNYLLEHDRKVVCDRGDFMNELCKLQEDKYYAEPASNQQYRIKNVDRGMNNSSGGVVGNVGMEEMNLKKRDLTKASIGVNVNKKKLFEEDQVNDMLKNLKKTLHENQDTISGSLPEKDGSVKGSRGKRENRNENKSKKLTLEEKLDRFVSSKSHLMSRRKRLLELSHKRSRKNDNRCVSGEDCQTSVAPDFLQDDYVKSPPPKYFFSHDRFIIDPLESTQALINSSGKTSEESAYEEAKENAFELEEKKKIIQNKDKESENSFSEKQSKSENNFNEKEKLISGKFLNKKERVSHNEGGKGENTILRGKIRSEDSERSLKIPPLLRGDNRYLFKETEESETKGEEKEKKEMVEDYHKEQKGRLTPKSFKSLFHKSEYEERLNKPKIRNFFMAKNRERQKLKSDLVKGHRKAELNHKENELSESKNLREKVREEMTSHDIENGQSENYEKKVKVVDQMKDELLEQQEKPEDQKSSKISEHGNEILGGSSIQDVLDSSINLIGNEKNKQKEKEESSVDNKKEEKLSDLRNYVKQHRGKIMVKSNPLKELKGDADFSFEIIRHQHPVFDQYYPIFEKSTLTNRKNLPFVFNTKTSDSAGKMNYLKKKQNLLFQYKSPQHYYVLENGIFPRQVYDVQNDKDGFRQVKNRKHYLKEPELNLYNFAKFNTRLQSKFDNYMENNLLRPHRISKLEYPYREGDSARPGSTFSVSYDKKLRPNQLRGKRHSRRYGNGYMKFGHRPEMLKISSHSHLLGEKTRSKRSASYSFQLARGFFRSEFDSKKPENRILHELGTCLPDQLARKREWAGSWASKPTSWKFSRWKRENLTADENGISSSIRFLQNGFNCPVVSPRDKIFKSAFDKQRLMQSYLNAPDYVLEETKVALKEKRQTAFPSKPNNSQDCEDVAHCMRFGDMWYSMYTIKRPMITQTIGIQMFDKYSLWDGTSQWRDLTKGKMIRVGTFLPKAEDELPSVSISFTGGKTEEIQAAIDPDNYLLLIPSHVTDPSKVNFYPQFDGGPAEYLLVQSKDVSSGGECNMIGTSFEAFARQPDRCNQRKGSCLKRQPVDLWREDMEARIRGKRGKYFVENFGTVPDSSIKTYTNLTGEFLALEYYGDYSSTIEIEVKADSNVIVRKGSNAQIPLVYIDSTSPKKTRIILSVLNIGLTSSYFRPRLGDCPPDLDPAWCPLEGQLVIIPPQQRRDFKLDLSGALPSRQIILSVQILNQVNKKIAVRKIVIKRGDRCVCAFHCKCTCVGNSADERTCQRLTLKDYRKAGYINSFPFRRGAATSASENIFKNIHIVFLTASYLLLLLGVLKGVLGIFFRRIGIAGVRVLTGPRELLGYYESELQSCSVLYDEYGFPIHPTTCQPVQIIPLWLEVIVNFLFFFLYPLRGLWCLLLSLPCFKATCSECDGCSRHDEGDSDQKSSCPLLSDGISPTCVHYNLTTVNSKKPKQEYLPYPTYKGDDDPLEEDDTEFVLQEMKRYRKE